jgi:CHASE3 domain sensor protein
MLALADSQAALHRSMLNSNPKFVENFAAAMSQVHSGVARLRQLVADNPLQQRRLDAIENSIRIWRWAATQMPPQHASIPWAQGAAQGGRIMNGCGLASLGS